MPNKTLETFVSQHFKALNGKMYCASRNKNTLIVALEKEGNLVDFVNDSNINSSKQFFLSGKAIKYFCKK